MSEPPGVALTPSSLLLLPAQTFTVSPKAPQHHPWTSNLSSCNQNRQSREVLPRTGPGIPESLQVLGHQGAASSVLESRNSKFQNSHSWANCSQCPIFVSSSPLEGKLGAGPVLQNREPHIPGPHRLPPVLAISQKCSPPFELGMRKGQVARVLTLSGDPSQLQFPS